MAMSLSILRSIQLPKGRDWKLPGITPDRMTYKQAASHSKDKSTYFFNEIPRNAITNPADFFVMPVVYPVRLIGCNPGKCSTRRGAGASQATISKCGYLNSEINSEALFSLTLLRNLLPCASRYFAGLISMQRIACIVRSGVWRKI